MTSSEVSSSSDEDKTHCDELSCKNEIVGNDEDDDVFVYTDSNHGNTFLQKLYNLYTEEKLCDVQLCIEENVLFAHKAVLVANSRYFEGN